MPDLLNNPPRAAARPAPPQAARPAPSREDPRRRSRVLAGISAASAAALAGLLVVEAVVLVVWMAEPRSAAPLSAALRTGAAFWLLGHGGRLQLPAGTAALIPLGLSVLFVALASRAGATVARVRPAGPRRRTVLASALSVSVPYGLIVALVAGVCSGGGLRTSVLTALAGGLVLAGVSAAVGAVRELPLAAPKRSRIRAVAAGVGAAGFLLIAASAVVAALALVTHLSAAADLAKPARAGAVGGVGLLFLQASLAPNAIVWTSSYLLGPGFAIGSGTLVSPASAHLGDVPGLPMLAGLPSSAAPWPAYALFLIPIGAGWLAGATLLRRLPRPPKLWMAALLGAGAGAVLGALLAAAAAVSGGSVTGGRLATIGPSAWQVGLLATLEVGTPAALSAVVLAWAAQRRRAAASAASAASAAALAEAEAAVRGFVGNLATGVFSIGLGFVGATAGGATLLVRNGTVLRRRVLRPQFRRRRDAHVQPSEGAHPTVDLTKTTIPLDLGGPAVDLTKHPAQDSADRADSADSRVKRRRVHLPRRLRRKSKVIRLPD